MANSRKDWKLGVMHLRRVGKIEEIESQVTSDAKAFTHSAALVKDHRSSSIRVAAENCELCRKVNSMERNTFEAVQSAEQHQVKVIAIDKGRASSVVCAKSLFWRFSE